jgi:hypothetical protein
MSLPASLTTSTTITTTATATTTTSTNNSTTTSTTTSSSSSSTTISNNSSGVRIGESPLWELLSDQAKKLDRRVHHKADECDLRLMLENQQMSSAQLSKLLVCNGLVLLDGTVEKVLSAVLDSQRVSSLLSAAGIRALREQLRVPCAPAPPWPTTPVKKLAVPPIPAPPPSCSRFALPSCGGGPEYVPPRVHVSTLSATTTPIPACSPASSARTSVVMRQKRRKDMSPASKKLHDNQLAKERMKKRRKKVD